VIDGSEPYGAESCVELVLLAERGGLDFVTLECGGEAVLDAVAVPARVAPVTDRIGLLPVLVAGWRDAAGEGVARAVATLDWVSQGRAGWAVVFPADDGLPAEDGLRGEGGAPLAGAGAEAKSGVAKAAEAVGAAAREWDACVGAQGARPPQGRPVIAVDVGVPGAYGVAARHADIAFVRAAGPEAAGRERDELRRLTAQAGRDPDRLLVFAELAIDLGGGELGQEPGAEVGPVPDGAGGLLFRGGPVDLAELIARWRDSGAVDGFLVRPAEPRRDLERFVNGTVALLQHRGLFRTFHPGATLREHLELHRPAQRFAASGGTAP
jgi:alkanesulfonate monooxygenase SsuD/methylene tetrahydromethanopterin reductase-like flavin-dependent oxidoreductase (luciferase family)